MFTNDATGAEFATKANGSVTWTAFNADESTIRRLMGHNVVLLFPTDVGGPSATLYTGRVVIEVDTQDVWEVVEDAGTALDICTRLTSA